MCRKSVCVCVCLYSRVGAEILFDENQITHIKNGKFSFQAGIQIENKTKLKLKLKKIKYEEAVARATTHIHSHSQDLLSGFQVSRAHHR